MKRALTMLAVALPLLAEEPARTAATPAAQPQPAVTATADSPLVAAAKRTNRRGKKASNVITNQTLVKASTATRITTTTNQGTLNLPAPAGPTPEMIAAEKAAEQRRRAEAEAQKRREKEAARQRKIEEAGVRSEEGMFDEAGADSSRAERDLEAARSQKPPQF